MAGGKKRIDTPKVLVEEEALARLQRICEERSIERPFILTGPVTRSILAERIKIFLRLDERSMAIIEHNSIGDGIIRKLREVVEHHDAIISVGGGRIIDIGKVLSGNRLYVIIPTALANDGLVSSFCTIHIHGQVKSLQGRRPDVLLVDMNTLLSAPERLWAAGFADLLSKRSSHFDWRIAADYGFDDIDPYAADLVESVGRSCVTCSHNFYERGMARLAFMLSNILKSGLATSLCGSTRPVSGSEHKIAHRLYQLRPNHVLHGEAVALGTIFSLYLQEQDWEGAVDLLIRAGLPTTAGELGISDEEMIQAVLTATMIRPERYTILEERKLRKEDAIRILRRVGILGRKRCSERKGKRRKV